MDKTKLSKAIKTLWLFWGFMMPGVGDAVLGPTLLDLQLLIDQTVDMFSYLMLSTGLGAVTGSVLAGLLFLKVNHNLKLAVAIILGSIFVAITPAVPSYAYILFIFGFQGICRGFIACYLLEVCNRMWEHKGAAFQFLFCGATTGSILTPLIVRPFLCVQEQHELDGTLDIGVSPGNGSTQGNATSPCTAADTSVQYAYIVLGVMTLPSGIAFLYYWIFTRNGSKDNEDTTELQYESFDVDRPDVDSTRPKLQYAYIVVLFCYYFPLLGNIMLYTTFLTAFGVEGPLNISKGSMVYMTSLFWGGFLLSRVVHTLITPYCGNFRIILFNSICLLVSGIILVSLSEKSEAALWVTTLTIGVFSGPYQGAALGWTENFLTIDTKVISVTVLGVGAGAMAIPFIGGMLYHYAPPMGHIYLVLAMIVFMCMMFALLVVIGERLKKNPIKTESEIKVEESDSYR